MSEEYRVKVGLQLKDGSLDDLKKQINSTQINPIPITIDITEARNRITNLRNQIQDLGRLRVNLNLDGGNGNRRNNVNNTTLAYRELLRTIREIGSVRTKISGLDINKNSSQVETLTAQLDILQRRYDNIRQTFDQRFNVAQLVDINEELQRVSNSVDIVNSKLSDKSKIKNITDSYNELFKIAKQISNIEIKIGSLDSESNENEISKLNSQLNTLKETYKKLNESFGSNLSEEQFANLELVIYDTKDKLAQLDAKVADTKQKFANGIKVKFDNGEFKNQMSLVDNKFNNITNKSSELKQSMMQLSSAFKTLKNAQNSDDIDTIIKSYNEYQDILKKVNNQIKINTREQKQSNDVAKLQDAKTSLQRDIDVWLKNNSAATRDFGEQITVLKAKIESCDSIQLDRLKAEWIDITKQAELAGKTSLSFADKLKSEMNKLGTYLSISMLFTEGTMAMRSMYDNVVEVDTAMTGLYRVADMTSEQYSNLYDDMTSSAKKYGATLSDVITSTADWVRLGFDENTANQLTEVTAMYQHISDLDNKTAVENLVTAYKGFQEQLLDLYNGDSVAAIRYIADIYNELGKILPMKNYIG